MGSSRAKSSTDVPLLTPPDALDVPAWSLQGVLMVKPKEHFGRAEMVRLWTHESLRVFSDRLVDDSDREWFHRHLNGMVRHRSELSIKKFHDRG